MRDVAAAIIKQSQTIKLFSAKVAKIKHIESALTGP